MVENLEERYDAYMAGSTQATPIIHTGDLPSADELAAELERFLANRPSGDDDRFGAGGNSRVGRHVAIQVSPAAGQVPPRNVRQWMERPVVTSTACLSVCGT